MINLPKDLKSLNLLLLKVRDDKRRAQLALDHFEKTQRSELEDKYIAAPVEVARIAGKSKEEIEAIKLSGKIEAEKEFKKAYDKKEKEVKLSSFTQTIKEIKTKIMELELEGAKTSSETVDANNQPKAQQRFEMNY